MFGSHGTLLEQGKADMYNACEWGNYCRAGGTGVGSRQVGRRAIIAYAAIVVRPDSPVYTPQQLAGRTVGVPFYAGTHYLALHLLEGFLPRDQIMVCSAPNGSRNRFNLMMKGEIEATTLTEPYISLAEKKGCRIICSAFFHGTEVASDRVDAETYAAFNRAVREAVRRINADKKKPISATSSITTRPAIRRSARSAGGSARRPSRRGRSGADPGRRDAAHLRVGEELGHAGGDASLRCSSSTSTCRAGRTLPCNNKTTSQSEIVHEPSRCCVPRRHSCRLRVTCFHVRDGGRYLRLLHRQDRAGRRRLQPGRRLRPLCPHLREILARSISPAARRS